MNMTAAGITAVLIGLASAKAIAQDYWPQFIGNYDCQIQKEVNVSDSAQPRVVTTFPASQRKMGLLIKAPAIPRNRDSCAGDAILFAKAVRDGGGIAVMSSQEVMERECNDRLELTVSTTLHGMMQQGYFTADFADDLDHDIDGGINFHLRTGSENFHLAGDWHFTYTEPRSRGDLTWFSGQCERK